MKSGCAWLLEKSPLLEYSGSAPVNVLERLRKANLRLKAQKCNKVGYLGHVVSKEGIEADPAKVSAVRDFPTPTDLKALRSFLGLAAYYRSSIFHRCRIPAWSYKEAGSGLHVVRVL